MQLMSTIERVYRGKIQTFQHSLRTDINKSLQQSRKHLWTWYRQIMQSMFVRVQGVTLQVAESNLMTFANKSPSYFNKCASGDGFSLCADHTDLIDLWRGVSNRPLRT